MTHVVIRCDASSGGGIGHLVRAISVADAAREAGHTVSLAGLIESPLALELVADAGLALVAAPSDLGVLAAEQGATIVHVDNYDIGSEAVAQTRRAGALLSSMEDGAFGRRRADVVIDSTIRAELGDRPDDDSGEVLLGIAYAPMRAQVRAARSARAGEQRRVGDAADVLIVMGGTDAVGATALVASVCRDADGVGALTVIAPAERWNEVRAQAGDGVDLIEPSPEFLARAARADLVVSAAGTTSWELACIGVPSMLVAVVENQRAGYEAALAEGVAQGLGTLDEIRAHPQQAVTRVEAAVAALREGRSWGDVGTALVDGRGAERIVAAWSETLERRMSERGQEIAARPAAADDALLLLRWRNDPVTRAMSRNPSAIGWQDHFNWYQRVLADASRELYVVESGAVPLGTVRFDALTAVEWEVSITLAPEVRGHGLARSILRAGEAEFAVAHPGVAIVAAILPDNIASQKLFQGAGYVVDPQRKDGDFDLLVRLS